MSSRDLTAKRAQRAVDGSSARSRRASTLEDIERLDDRTLRLSRATDLVRSTVHRAPDQVHGRAVAALIQMAIDLQERKLQAGRTVSHDDGRPYQWSIRRKDRHAVGNRHRHYTGRVQAAGDDRRKRLVAAIDYLRAVGNDAPDGLLDATAMDLVGLADRLNEEMGVPA